jgi:hypothetical protein
LSTSSSFPSTVWPWFDGWEVIQRKKNRNQMANAHLPKPSLCSPTARGVNCPKTSFSLATSLRRFAKAIQRVSILRTARLLINPKINCCWLFFSLFFTALVGTGQCSAYNYDLSGRLEYNFFHEGKVIRSTTNFFSVSVRGNASSIRSWGIPEHGSIRVKSYEYVTDGENSVFFTIFDADPIEVEKSQMTSLKERFNRAAMIYTGQFPPNHIGLMGPVWLATASATFFQQKSNSTADIRPLYFLGNNNPDISPIEVSASWSLNMIPPHLPESILQYANENVFTMVNSNYLNFMSKQLPQLYRHGYTNAFFRTIEWMNIGDIKLPKRFILDGYVPLPDGKNSKELATQVVYRGFIDSAAITSDEPIILPKAFTKWTKVYEYRFGLTNGQPFVYSSESGELLSEHDLKTGLHEKKKNESAQAKSRLATNRMPRFLVLSAIFVLTIFFVRIICYSKKNKN